MFDWKTPLRKKINDFLGKIHGPASISVIVAGLAVLMKGLWGHESSEIIIGIIASLLGGYLAMLRRK